MNIDKATVARIRPVSWKLCVQGEQQASYVRDVLSESRIECSDLQREPELQDPPVFSFVATPQPASPLTAPELRSILEVDKKIEVAFDV
jgi:hypothetical protein